jgi:hypothetical protein
MKSIKKSLYSIIRTATVLFIALSLVGNLIPMAVFAADEVRSDASAETREAQTDTSTPAETETKPEVKSESKTETKNISSGGSRSGSRSNKSGLSTSNSRSKSTDRIAPSETLALAGMMPVMINPDIVIQTEEINDLTDNGADLLPGDLYGTAIANIGDINKDGVDDIAIGAYGTDGVNLDEGAIFIHFMDANENIISTTRIDGATANGPELGLYYGYGVGIANIGDVNGDTIPDIAVGTRFWELKQGEDLDTTGAIFIHLLNTDGLPKSTFRIDQNTANGPTNIQDGDVYGVSVENIGDLNNDGYAELAVGAYLSDIGGADLGAMYIHFLGANGTIKSTKEISKLTANGPDLENLGVYGRSVANMGDLDNNNVNDIAVGAWGRDAGGTDRGAVYIHLLDSDGDVLSTTEINDFTENGPELNDSDWYGLATENMGDLDNNGINDIAVSTIFKDTNGTDKGAIHISLLNADLSVKATVSLDDLTLNGAGLNNGDNYGADITNLGDLDGNGVTDIAVGAHYSDFGGENKGGVFVHYMKPLATLGNPDIILSKNFITIPENGNGDSFTAVLTEAPVGNVVLDVSVDNNVISAAPTTLTFNSLNWDIPQNIDITVNAQVEVDTIATVTISVNDALSDDAFDPIEDKYLQVTLLGDEDTTIPGVPGIILSKSAISIPDGTTSDSFTVVLASAPSSTVVVDITSDNAILVVDPILVTFEPINWNIAQNVNIIVANEVAEDTIVTITAAVNDDLSDDTYDVVENKTLVVTLFDNNDDDDNGNNGGSSGGGGGSGSKKYGCHDLNATNYTTKYTHKQSTCKYAEVLGASTSLSCAVNVYLTRPIKFGAENNLQDVMLLEQFLNTYEGANLPVDGFYSQADYNAVVKWQEKNSEDVLAPWGITKGTGYVFITSLQKIKQTHAAACGGDVVETQILSCSKPLLYPTKTISKGQNTNDTEQVKLLEKYMNTYERSGLIIDGIYTDYDSGKVSAWQIKNNIKDTLGSIGQNSLNFIASKHIKQCSLLLINPEF